MEDDDAMDQLVEAILLASKRHRLPTSIETHRATITQDMLRTVRLTERFPEVRFNGDFSPYYTGQEMVYGGFETKLDFLEPVFQRVVFMHARIGSPSPIEAAVGSPTQRPATAIGDLDFLADFKAIWTRAMSGFKQNAGPGDVLIFCPELLSRQHDYAQCLTDANGNAVVECDRYAEAIVYDLTAIAFLPCGIERRRGALSFKGPRPFVSAGLSAIDLKKECAALPNADSQKTKGPKARERLWFHGADSAFYKPYGR